MKELWPIVLPILLGGAGVFLLLPRPKPYPRWWGSVLAALALVLAGVFWVRTGEVRAESVLFYAFSAIAVTAGALMITQSNPARAALSFALVVLATSGLFLLQMAPFLMAAAIIIYAGAIIVTFLFVLMLAQQEGASDADQRSREPQLATAAGCVLLFALLYVLLRSYDTSSLDRLMARVERAMTKPTNGEMAQALEEERFFEDLNKVLASSRGGRNLVTAEDRVMELQEKWFTAKAEKDPATAGDGMRNVLEALANLGDEVRGSWGDLPPSAPLSTGSVPGGKPVPVRDYRGRAAMPAENTAFLGRSLFSDYLLAVELAGMLLTVATIGAIVIAGRKNKGLESGVRSQASANGA